MQGALTYDVTYGMINESRLDFFLFKLDDLHL